MKKIILIPALFIGVLLRAQSSQNSRSAGFKQMTVEEANRLNGVAQPTINGKPYSQHKAEQEALKRQQEAKRAAVQQSSVKGSSIDAPVVSAKTEAAVVKADPKPAPEVPAQFRLPATVQQWTGRESAASTVAKNPVFAEGQNPATGPVATTAKPAAVVPQEKRSPEQLEKARQMEEAARTVASNSKPAATTATPAIPAELKAETGSSPVPEATEAKPQPTGPSANKQQ